MKVRHTSVLMKVIHEIKKSHQIKYRRTLKNLKFIKHISPCFYYARINNILGKITYTSFPLMPGFSNLSPSVAVSL